MCVCVSRDGELEDGEGLLGKRKLLGLDLKYKLELGEGMPHYHDGMTGTGVCVYPVICTVTNHIKIIITPLISDSC